MKVDREVSMPDKEGNKNYEWLFSAFEKHNYELALSAVISETRS